MKRDNKKKNILVICQYYKPEPFRISDICEELVRRGYEVQVVTGYPNYPEGKLYSGYGRGKHIDEYINGVKVHRCFTVPRGTGTIKRMLNYYSYAISSIVYVLSKKCNLSVDKHYDVVLCNQLSPVMMAYAALAYKKRFKVPVIMYCLDLWPESLIAGGFSRRSIIYKYYHFVSKKIYTKTDKILITSRLFQEYLEKEFDIKKERVKYLPQYAESIFEQMPPKEETGFFDFMFAGNIGTAQSINTILEAAKLLKNEPVRFHIVGGGVELENMRQMAHDMKNTVFYGRRPLEDMPDLYAKADAMLVTMTADPVLSLTLPGKVQTYMAVGKPIIGAANGETRTVIEKAECGFCGNADNAIELADNIRKFISDNTDRHALGRNARRYYEAEFTKNLFIDCLELNLFEE